jgi:DNA-binding CsgD family transcriptional regulator
MDADGAGRQVPVQAKPVAEDHERPGKDRAGVPRRLLGEAHQPVFVHVPSLSLMIAAGSVAGEDGVDLAGGSGASFRPPSPRGRNERPARCEPAGDDSRCRAAAGALAVARSLGAAPLAADLELLSRRGRLAAGSNPDDALRRLGLTEREAELLGLLVEGRTNRQIGDTLFISEKTASVHVTNLLRKLGVGNRAEAAEMSRRLR